MRTLIIRYRISVLISIGNRPNVYFSSLVRRIFKFCTFVNKGEGFPIVHVHNFHRCTIFGNFPYFLQISPHYWEWKQIQCQIFVLEWVCQKYMSFIRPFFINVRLMTKGKGVKNLEIAMTSFMNGSVPQLNE